MKYFKRFKEPDGRWTEVTYEEALHSVLGSYRDCEDIRKLLETDATIIPCMYAEIWVTAN